MTHQVKKGAEALGCVPVVIDHQDADRGRSPRRRPDFLCFLGGRARASLGGQRQMDREFAPLAGAFAGCAEAAAVQLEQAVGQGQADSQAALAEMLRIFSRN